MSPLFQGQIQSVSRECGKGERYLQGDLQLIQGRLGDLVLPGIASLVGSAAGHIEDVAAAAPLLGEFLIYHPMADALDLVLNQHLGDHTVALFPAAEGA